MKTIWKIDVHGEYGYSFAIKGEIEDGGDAIHLAESHDLYEDPSDADYATAEDITDDEYTINAFKDCITEI